MVFIESSPAKCAVDQRKKTIPLKSNAMGIAGTDSIMEEIKSGKFATVEEKSEKISDANEKNPEWENSAAAFMNPKPASDRDATIHAPKPAVFTKNKRRSYCFIRFTISRAKPVGGSGNVRTGGIFLSVFIPLEANRDRRLATVIIF